MSATVHSILTGAQEPRTRRVVAEKPPAATGPVDHAWNSELEQSVQALLEAQKDEATQTEERQRALEARIAEEQAARVDETRTLQAELAQSVGEREGTIAGLRATLGETLDETAKLQTQIAQATAERQRLQDETDRALEEHRQALEAARATPPQVIREAPTRPEKIDFEYHRAPNGLLRRVVLKAQGYDDVAIDVERGADNRMQNLKVR